MADQSEVPDPLCGKDNDNPGFWATLAKTNSWSHNNQPETRPWLLYNKLKTYQLVREPGLRAPISGIEFFYEVNPKSVNVEALLAQSVGYVMPPEDACEECKKGNGPFTSCVVVPGLGKEMAECANCHWHVPWPGGNACVFAEAPVSRQSSRFSTGVFVAAGEALMGLDTALRREIVLRNDAHVKGDLDTFDVHHARIQEIVNRKRTLQFPRR